MIVARCVEEKRGTGSSSVSSGLTRGVRIRIRQPTQPFTILPSEGLQDLSDRARLGAEVFRSGHRLPTMTIDEYLEEERRRGNILTGGG